MTQLTIEMSWARPASKGEGGDDGEMSSIKVGRGQVDSSADVASRLEFFGDNITAKQVRYVPYTEGPVTRLSAKGAMLIR